MALTTKISKLDEADLYNPSATPRTPGIAPETQWKDYSSATTLLTKNTGATSKPLYTGDRVRWTRISLRLVSAGGAVAVGFQANVAPPLGGTGAQLLFDAPVVLTVPPGQRVWYAADSRQRIAFTIEPVPWLEQIFNTTKGILGAIARLVPPALQPHATGKGSPQTIVAGASPPTPRPYTPVVGQRPPAPAPMQPGVVRYVRK